MQQNQVFVVSRAKELNLSKDVAPKASIQIPQGTLAQGWLFIRRVSKSNDRGCKLNPEITAWSDSHSNWTTKYWIIGVFKKNGDKKIRI